MTHLPTAGPKTDDEDVFDPDVLATLRAADAGDSHDFAVRLIEEFVSEAESRVEALWEGARHQDPELLKATAHTLKGSSLVMGARRMAALSAQLEDTLRGTAQSPLTPLQLDAFDEELVRLRRASAAERMARTYADSPAKSSRQRR